MTIKDKVLKVAATLAAGSPVLAFAQETSPNTVPTAPVTSISGFVGIITNVINWAFYLILIISVLFFLWAGFLYITGGSDSDTQAKAKNIIIYAVVGVAIALLAQAFQYIAVGLTGANVSF